MKHKHAELIKAWADGAEIQCKQFKYGDEYEWVDDDNPYWSVSFEYRIKPTPRPQWQQDLIDAARAGKVVEFNNFRNNWVCSSLTDLKDDYLFGPGTQSDYRIRPEKVTRYLWAIKNDVVNKPYWFSGQMFMTKNEVDEAYSNFEHKRLDWSATDFEG